MERDDQLRGDEPGVLRHALDPSRADRMGSAQPSQRRLGSDAIDRSQALRERRAPGVQHHELQHGRSARKRRAADFPGGGRRNDPGKHLDEDHGTDQPAEPRGTNVRSARHQRRDRREPHLLRRQRSSDRHHRRSDADPRADGAGAARTDAGPDEDTDRRANRDREALTDGHGADRADADTDSDAAGTDCDADGNHHAGRLRRRRRPDYQLPVLRVGELPAGRHVARHEPFDALGRRLGLALSPERLGLLRQTDRLGEQVFLPLQHAQLRNRRCDDLMDVPLRAVRTGRLRNRKRRRGRRLAPLPDAVRRLRLPVRPHQRLRAGQAQDPRPGLVRAGEPDRQPRRPTTRCRPTRSSRSSAPAPIASRRPASPACFPPRRRRSRASRRSPTTA